MVNGKNNMILNSRRNVDSEKKIRVPDGIYISPRI